MIRNSYIGLDNSAAPSKNTPGKRIGVMLVLIVLFTLCNLVVMCGQQSLNIHEHNHMLVNDMPESNGILYHQLHIWYTRLVPHANNALVQRLPAIICSLATLFLTYRLGTRWGGRRLGILSAFVLSANVLFLAFGINHRFYALNMALSVVATLLWWRTLQREDDVKAWWLYCLGMMAVMTSMFVSAAIAIPHAVFYLLLCQRKWRALGRYAVLLIIMLATLGLLCLNDPTSYGILASELHWDQESQRVTSLIISNGFSYDKMVNNVEGVATATIMRQSGHQLQAVNAALILTLLAGLLWSLLAWWQQRHRHRLPALSSGPAPSNPALFPALLLGVTLAVGSLMIFSAFGRVLITINNLSWSLPFVSILIAQALNGPKLWRLLTVPLVCLSLMYGAPLLTQGTYICGPGCGKIHDTIALFQHPGDLVIADKNSTLPGLEEYFQDINLGLPNNNVRPEMTALQKVDMCAKIAQATHPIWLSWEDYTLFLRLAPDLRFMRGRRAWIVYKPHLDPSNAPLVRVIRENYDPNYGPKVSETHWSFPEGMLSLMRF